MRLQPETIVIFSVATCFLVFAILACVYDQQRRRHIIDDYNRVVQECMRDGHPEYRCRGINP